MALPVGQISASDVNIELARSSTNLMTLDEQPVRALAQAPSGTISFQNLQGKSSGPVRKTIYVPYSAPANNVSITSTHPQISPQYVAGNTDIVVQVASGVVVGSATGDFAMAVSGFNTADTITINNQGYIVGAGGGGGAGSTSYGTGGGGGSGGWALNVSGLTTPGVTIDNTGMIAGGGGGGGGGGGAQWARPRPRPQGGPINFLVAGGNGGGGQGEVGGSPGGSFYGAGGGGGGQPYPFGAAGSGGPGGGWGSPGAPGGNAPQRSGGGGGAGGGYLYALGKPVTWINTGTRYGTTA